MTTSLHSDAPSRSSDTEISIRFFTISNLLSISRAVLVIPFAVVMLTNTPPSRVWGATIIVLAALTDKFDGVVARKYNQITEWGKVLDPLADKIAVASVAIVLLMLGNIQAWFVIALLVRDALIFSGGMYIKAKKKVVLQSNEAGKWTVGVVSLALVLMVLDAQSSLIDICIWASVVLLAFSFFLYMRRFIEVMKG